MPNYKIVAHRDKFGTIAVYTKRNVDSRDLAQIVYGLTCEYPGCSITCYPEQNIIIQMSASIKKQLERLNGNASCTDTNQEK